MGYSTLSSPGMLDPVHPFCLLCHREELAVLRLADAAAARAVPYGHA